MPQATLLPISVERVIPGSAKTAGPRYVQARERDAATEMDTLVFDVVVTGADGQVQEMWQGLRLKLMSGTTFSGSWSPPLLGPYLERRLQEHLPEAAVSVVVERNPDEDRRSRSNLAIQQALGEPALVQRRPDGKPEVVAQAGVRG